MPTSKLISLAEAIGRFVADGSSVAMGLCLEALIPFAAGHEIMRQRKRGLTLIGPISDILFDQVIGVGCANRVQAVWSGMSSPGPAIISAGRWKPAADDRRPLQPDLGDGAQGRSPVSALLPARTALGSDLFTTNPGLKPMRCPFTGDTLAAVAAISPMSPSSMSSAPTNTATPMPGAISG
jgi:glutaconate CoA-transferase subunit A